MRQSELNREYDQFFAVNRLVLKLADASGARRGPERNAFREKAEKLIRDFLAERNSE